MNKGLIICSVVLLAILASVQAIYISANVEDRTLVPWYAQVETIKNNGDELHCGGAILKPLAILTTSKCLGDMVPTKIVVYIGYLNYTSEKIAISKLIPHPDYKADINDFNIAILITEKRLVESPTIKLVTLPTTGGNPYGALDVIFYGLGMVGLSNNSYIIQVAPAKTRWNGFTTINMYLSTLACPNDMIIEKLLSDATGVPCDGDESSILMFGDVICGVYKVTKGDGDCEKHPGTDEATVNYVIYEPVTKHLAWINNVTASNVVA